MDSTPESQHDITADPFHGLMAVVDDDASVRRSLARLLKSVGVRCDVHESGTHFLKSPALHEVDCLLLDLHLPGMSGHEVLTEVRDAASKLPVILMTGRYEVDFTKRALAAGASAVLQKPFGHLELFEAVRLATGQPIQL